MWNVPVLNRVRLAHGPAMTILCIAIGVGCETGKNPYDTPPSRLEGDQAVALFRREIERRGLRGSISSAEKVETLRRHRVETPGLFDWSPKETLAISVDTCGVARRRGARTAPSYEFGLTPVAAPGPGDLGQTSFVRRCQRAPSRFQCSEKTDSNQPHSAVASSAPYSWPERPSSRAGADVLRSSGALERPRTSTRAPSVTRRS